MDAAVNSRQAARIARTEARILEAATELFVRDGYQPTTLAAVAAAAGVGERTVYVRFGTKVALLRRAVDVAVAGDAEDRPVAERPWVLEALGAATLEERVDALVAGSVALMARAGDLFEVALQAQSGEPALVEAFEAGRTATRALLHRFVASARSDGLLDDCHDRDGADARDEAEPGRRTWQEETAALAAHAETYLLLRRTTGWSPQEYGEWLARTLREVLAPPRPSAGARP
jgi:AcrR family transcriptional regulator